ncbi:MAG: hypothetical protein AAB967_04145, partial [Patescibacteria group bacterium]
ISRRLGYKPRALTQKGEMDCVRPLQGNNYPRFHLYIKEGTFEGKEVLIFNLHLDQKKPSYEGAAAHSGDYDGEVVQEEAERIKGVLFED